MQNEGFKYEPSIKTLMYEIKEQRSVRKTTYKKEVSNRNAQE